MHHEQEGVALQVYMSRERGTYAGPGCVSGLPEDGTIFRHRGPVRSAYDDHHGFKKAMARSGYMVVLTTSLVGDTEKDGVLKATAADLNLPCSGGYIDPLGLPPQANPSEFGDKQHEGE